MPNTTPVKIKIDLNTLEILTCPSCKHSIFRTNSSIFKKISSVQSPTGKAQLLRIELVTCVCCGQDFTIKEGELLPVTI